MKISDAIALRINEICELNNSNVCNICLNGGMSPSNIYDIQKGRTTGTKIITIARFCDGANMTLSEFFNKDYFNEIDDYY